MLLRPLLLILLMAVVTPGLRAQIFRNAYNQEVRISREPDILSLSVKGSTFFNNNEFFHTDAEGYTLTGAYFQPELNYSVTDRMSFGAGIHLMKYNGREEFAQILPLFRIDYRVTGKFTVTMGSFNGGEAFLLPEPLYQFENQFTGLVNNGIRLDYRSTRIRSLTWLNWEHFILPGDSLQEQFTVGSSEFFTVVSSAQDVVRIPVHFVIHHQGGQINVSDNHVISTLNFGTGLYVGHFFGAENRGEAWFNPMIFYDGNDEGMAKGFAWYPQVGVHYRPFSLTAGYFRGRKFTTIRGEPLFFSPLPRAGYPLPPENRSLITFKAGIGKKISETSSLILRFEGYYDTAISKLQYTYGLHMILNEDFFIARLRRAK